ncbi:protein of unknown function DUF2935 [Gottschalkia acidurici 9a]|uniref:DUF2935 domain-containing protein n=1 Tax=Gottschalkia acidurici (strain ATCC 7906 / DSM 604 / BCRC 14475 / CIP 104303 / KCTC 5404 / NCIMB 10678 / 9a) TaxID=1128398 RepID=K0AXG7_GOTA9|nr:DUF2935 domain-containing protein [Gottschalkia acidurici]AFS77415.1 protein of unknown function DUF2935 [Gottschalkia acidurici 9a]
MLSSNEFVRRSLEVHIFFARIMKEHSLFLQLSFTPRDASFSRRADELRMEFDELLWDVVCLSNGVIRNSVINSGEIVTPYTLRAENITSYLTGVKIPEYITKAEMELRAGTCKNFDPAFERGVCTLNNRAIDLIRSIIEFKSSVLSNVLSCKMFTTNYPLMIDHILREAKLYLRMITKLQKRENIDIEKEIYGQELFWNKMMADHSKFIRGLLDPTEENLIKLADDFAKEFDKLTKELKAAIDKSLPTDKITDAIFEATKKVHNFNTQSTKGILDCEIRSIIIPLLGDHVLREANHFIRLLKSFQEED